MLKKFASVLVVLALVAVAGVSVASAQTATVQSLQAQIQALQAMLAQLGGAAAPAASSATFTRDLTVGSKGADVTALQQMLIEAGDLNVAAPTGYFGALTKKALATYQKDSGITPASGYFGQKTRTFVATMAPATTGTPAAGATPTPSASVNDGSDGSSQVLSSSVVTSSQTLKKGDVKDVLSFRVQATGGKVAVNRVDVQFNMKPWLIFNQLVLKDGSGNVLATKTLTSSADATEVTVNSAYNVRFEGLNAVVTPGTDLVLVVNASVLASTDKISSYPSITVNVPVGGVRDVNGKGYTETGPASASTASATLTMSTSGSVADMYTRLSPNAPTTRTVAVSTTANTNDVTLGMFSIKTQNQGAKITSLNVNLNDTVTGVSHSADPTELFQNVRITDGSNTWGGTLASTGVITFTNLNIQTTQDSWKDLTVKADVIATTTTAFSASTTLDASTVVGNDANDNVMTCNGGNTCSTYGTTADVTTSDTKFSSSAVSVSNMSTTMGGAVSGLNGSVAATVGYNVGYKFTLTNNGNNDIYVSGYPGAMLGTTSVASTGGATVSSSTISTVSVSGSYAQDSTAAVPTYYVIPAGLSRDFTFGGVLSKVGGTGIQTSVLTINKINYGTVNTNTTSAYVDYGLSALSASVNL